MKLDHFLTPHTKENLKWIKNLNVRPETIKLLEENIGKTLSDINHSRIFYDPPLRILEIKAKINKLDLINIRVFSNESSLRIRWPKYWSFSFSISPSNEHSGLISFRMDWLDLLAVQGTLKSLLQHHSSKASIL